MQDYTGTDITGGGLFNTTPADNTVAQKPLVTTEDLLGYTPTEEEPATTETAEKTVPDYTQFGAGELAFQTMFPNTSVGIQQGTVPAWGGGSLPIYATSSLYPFGIQEARNNALMNAVMKQQLAKQKQDAAQKLISWKYPEGVKAADTVTYELNKLFFSDMDKIYEKIWAQSDDMITARQLAETPGEKGFRDEINKTINFYNNAGQTSINLFKLAEDTIKSTTDLRLDVSNEASKTAHNILSGTAEETIALLKDPKKYGMARKSMETFNNTLNVVQTQILPSLLKDKLGESEFLALGSDPNDAQKYLMRNSMTIPDEDIQFNAEYAVDHYTLGDYDINTPEGIKKREDKVKEVSEMLHSLIHPQIRQTAYFTYKSQKGGGEGYKTLEQSFTMQEGERTEWVKGVKTDNAGNVKYEEIKDAKGKITKQAIQGDNIKTEVKSYGIFGTKTRLTLPDYIEGVIPFNNIFYDRGTGNLIDFKDYTGQLILQIGDTNLEEVFNEGTIGETGRNLGINFVSTTNREIPKNKNKYSIHGVTNVSIYKPDGFGGKKLLVKNAYADFKDIAYILESKKQGTIGGEAILYPTDDVMLQINELNKKYNMPEPYKISKEKSAFEPAKGTTQQKTQESTTKKEEITDF